MPTNYVIVYFLVFSTLQSDGTRQSNLTPHFGPRNPNAFSRYIKNKSIMSSLERKSFKLPCGKTLAQSWGALRKAWLAFKIAHRNYDYWKIRRVHTHYKKFTDARWAFESPFSIGKFYLMTKATSSPYNENLALETEQDEQNPEQNELERTPEYDWNKDIILHTPIPDPRHEIFLRKMEKSCPLPDKPTTAIVHKEDY